MARETILCLENGQSRFAVSQEIFAARTYQVATATNKQGAITALKAVPAIRAAVLALPEVPPDEQLQIASEMETVRPGLPKIIVGPPGTATAENLAIFYVERISKLLEELNSIIAASRAGRKHRADLIEESRELRAESRRLRAETHELVREACEKAKRGKRER